MRAIVTGAAGFIGNALTQRLTQEGWDILAIDNLEMGDEEKWRQLKCEKISLDVKYLGAYKDEKFDYIFHFASPSSNILFSRDPFKNKFLTVEGYIAMANLAKLTGAKLVFPSTSSIYGVLNDYAKTKKQLEELDSLFEINSLILRIFAGFGPGENHKADYASIIYQFCKQALNNEEIVVYGDGRQSRDYVYIDDIIDEILKMVSENLTGVKDIGTGVSTSTTEILRMITSILGKELKVSYIEKPKNYLEFTKAFDIRKGSITVQKGISNIIKSIKQI